MHIDPKRVLIQLKNELEDHLGPPFDVPIDISVGQLQAICKKLLDDDELQSYNFYIEKDIPIVASLNESYDFVVHGTEKILNVFFFPQSLHKVYPVTRCTSSLPGHEGAILSIQFSPNGKKLATGSGDQTVRFWDLETQMPHLTLKEHKHWVLCISWSPNSKKLASADKAGKICIWDVDTGKLLGKPINAHNQWINCIAWEPLHKNHECRRFASCSKDTVIKVWDSVTRLCTLCLSGHTASVTCIKWGAKDLLYSASQDRTIKIWKAQNGSLFRTLQCHAHWVNALALSTDYLIRTSCFDFENLSRPFSNNNSKIDPLDLAPVEQGKRALERYERLNKNDQERMVSASDDFTLCLWHDPLHTPVPSNSSTTDSNYSNNDTKSSLPKSKSESKYLIAKMTGHSQTVNHVQFSPDGSIIASASFDKSIKIWNGLSGKYLFSLRGHVQRVYQVSFSNDSRLLISGSADSTLKIWKIKQGANTNNNTSKTNTDENSTYVSHKKIKKDIETRKKTVQTTYLCVDLPGHADEVYAIDWSPDGATVASGGKDKILKM